jgi:hypothetical protein
MQNPADQKKNFEMEAANALTSISGADAPPLAVKSADAAASTLEPTLSAGPTEEERKRYLPENKKLNAAPTFPEKVS